MFCGKVIRADFSASPRPPDTAKKRGKRLFRQIRSDDKYGYGAKKSKKEREPIRTCTLYTIENSPLFILTGAMAEQGSLCFSKFYRYSLAEIFTLLSLLSFSFGQV